MAGCQEMKFIAAEKASAVVALHQPTCRAIIFNGATTHIVEQVFVFMNLR